MKRSLTAWIGICVFLLPVLPQAWARQIIAAGKTYYSLDEVGSRYGMLAVGSRLWNQKRNMIFERDRRGFSINGVRYSLSFAPYSGGGKLFLSHLDILKLLDPIMLPQIVPRHQVQHIVIDPGHGGRDCGAIGKCSQEKQLTLAIARKVRDRLVRYGCRVTMTRNSDLALTLPQRAAIARALRADLFLSIHINAVRNPALAGIETYALTPAGAPSTASQKPSAQSYPGNRCDLNNIALANMIQRYLLSRTGGEDHGVKRARFLVLREITMPGVLIECGFISNRAEEQRMGVPAYQEKLARGIADGVIAYRYSIIRNQRVLQK